MAILIILYERTIPFCLSFSYEETNIVLFYPKAQKLRKQQSYGSYKRRPIVKNRTEG